MVYLDRIYTKSGDHGETSLGDGSRVPKTDLRIRAYGDIDELNAVLGIAVTETSFEAAEGLLRIQNDLFDLGADLCVPEPAATSDTEPASQPLRVTARQISALEEWIDHVNEQLPPLKSFVLPGGTRAAANLHHARTVCRRAEISVLQLAERDALNPNVSIYLNRLSDLLFVLSRAANDDGSVDVLWIPGGQSGTE